jgi:hypothetical protein
MLMCGFDAVLESRKQMDAKGLIHKPVVGRVVLAMTRTGMPLVNHLPPLKRRMAEAQQRLRVGDQNGTILGQNAPHQPAGHQMVTTTRGESRPAP